jgi:thymidylate synthase (FAD)
MPRLVPKGETCDGAIVQAARVSYGKGTKTVTEDSRLIRYLLRHRHTTPFEMIETKWLCIMPIFVARQWIRHRTASYNEYSARYSVVKDRFYIPEIENVRKQSNTNKQGGTEPVSEAIASDFLRNLQKMEESCYDEYELAIERGISREQARMFLPVNAYTEWYFKIDLHNLFHFLSLRIDKHAQQEIQDYANPMFEMLKELCPDACQAFIDYRLEAITLSGPEIYALKHDDYMFLQNQREAQEFQLKKERLGL